MLGLIGVVSESSFNSLQLFTWLYNEENNSLVTVKCSLTSLRFKLINCLLFYTLQKAAKTPLQLHPAMARQKWLPWHEVTWLDEQERSYPSEILSICVCWTSVIHPSVPAVHTTHVPFSLKYNTLVCIPACLCMASSCMVYLVNIQTLGTSKHVCTICCLIWSDFVNNIAEIFILMQAMICFYWSAEVLKLSIVLNSLARQESWSLCYANMLWNLCVW